MKRRIFYLALLLLLGATSAFAHRLDEYLQASTFGIEGDRVELKMRLTPGTQVFERVLAAIDTNQDGLISEAEQHGYAALIRRDLSLSIDQQPMELRLLSCTFPDLDDMKQGLGDIQVNFEAALPKGGTNRLLTFENHHFQGISVYLANSLVPADPTIHILTQDRNYDQSHYQLAFIEAPAISPGAELAGVSASSTKLNQNGDASLFRAFFYQGIHHILTGYDHLLFIAALVLAAATFWELIKVVTAFTIAHTLTLTLATLNVLHLPSSVVESLISASIVFIALQNVFWPDRARGWSRLAAAFFFGLFHGLGFAGGLIEAMQQMQTGTMLLAICAFSLGIELGHQMVVLPLFALLKATRLAQADAAARAKLSVTVQRFGSAGISLAGMYYLCLALNLL